MKMASSRHLTAQFVSRKPCSFLLAIKACQTPILQRHSTMTRKKRANFSVSLALKPTASLSRIQINGLLILMVRRKIGELAKESVGVSEKWHKCGTQISERVSNVCKLLSLW